MDSIFYSKKSKILVSMDWAPLQGGLGRKVKLEPFAFVPRDGRIRTKTTVEMVGSVDERLLQ